MSENTEMIVVDEPAEQMVQIPVKQYAESIMALQKLKDIAKVTKIASENVETTDDYWWTIIESIRAIAEG